jgi:hypothetical protein
VTDPNYVDPADYARWEAERKAGNKADDEIQRDIARRRDLADIPLLLDRIEELAFSLVLATECFAAALERGRRERDALRLIVLEYEPTALRGTA